MKKEIYPTIQMGQISNKLFGTILLSISLLATNSNCLFAQDKGITIHQEVIINASPQRIYETLLSSKKFSECIKKSFADFSPASANIDSTDGGAFTIFDGHIIGRNIEIVPNQRIVQAWRVVDWPAGIYSIVRFEFKLQGSVTNLIFDQVGFPEGLKVHLSEGWQQHYWDALNKYFQ
jgi:activator of HSP90 ATPase